ncbi:MAG: hypothetical protein LC689_23130 [Myxococcales bacterium]|nr:hypothetical protein [Myxococcales bacterium]
MPALFATFLLLALALAGAIAFSSERTRKPLKWMLVVALLFAWGSLALALKQIVLRTGSTLVTPGGVQQPHLIEQAAREGWMLALSLGGPALLATALGWLSLKATRRPKR